MGANSVHCTYDGTLSETQLKQRFASDQASDRIENGNSYSGTIGMLTGLFVETKVFEDEQKANDYVLEHTNKWGPGLAVKFKHREKVVTKQPTFNNKLRNDGYGHRAYTVEYSGQLGKSTRHFIPADQLSARDKERLVTADVRYQELKAEYQAANSVYHPMLRQLENLSQPCPNLTELRQARARVVKASAAHDKAEQALTELNKTLVDQLYAVKTEDRGLRWLVGGWASS